MNLNKKRIFIVAIISTLLVGMFMLSIFTDFTSVVKGKVFEAFVKEGETEFDLEETASLRNKPNFSSKIIGTIEKGTHVQVLVELNKWVKITDGTNEGWVVKQNVVTIEVENEVVEPENIVENNITTEPENIVDNTTTTEPENVVENNVTTEPENTIGNEVTTKPENSISNETSNNGISSSNVGKTGVVNVDTAKVREEPDGKLIGLVDLDDKVEILAEEGDWYKVNVDEYENCYIAKRLVTIK